MKNISLGLFVCLASLSTATLAIVPPYPGAWLSASIGQANQPGYKDCHIEAGRIMTGGYGIPGDYPKNDISWQLLESLFAGTAKEPLLKGHHLPEMTYDLNVTAGQWPYVRYILLISASEFEYRNGESSKTLMEIARRECGSFLDGLIPQTPQG